MASLKCKTELNCKYHAFQTWRPVHFCSQQWWAKVKKLLIEFNVLRYGHFHIFAHWHRGTGSPASPLQRHCWNVLQEFEVLVTEYSEKRLHKFISNPNIMSYERNLKLHVTDYAELSGKDTLPCNTTFCSFICQSHESHIKSLILLPKVRLKLHNWAHPEVTSCSWHCMLCYLAEEVGRGN